MTTTNRPTITTTTEPTFESAAVEQMLNTMLTSTDRDFRRVALRVMRLAQAQDNHHTMAMIRQVMDEVSTSLKTQAQ